ncbi:MAG: F0F1 ATP synthase subunit gamma [Bauldia sp.]|uniref:F0F1 ATP synthase subunit gamma n=1 Tax=Bauldia sp. TaxID=2575872 RepID=UPI001D7C5035|nr:F0F1 ATP synthase subunit gamma [Bauldia sp.]MCB1496215.1 F0F1 ATP synthase subunit gamma [Bauldia sp.]
MASLKELRNRIASVKATQKITRAMQMVAASKLRRAQAAAEAARPYSVRMNTVLANLAKPLRGRDDAPRLLAGTGRDDVHLLVVCTAERGLCGAFNSSIARLARDHAVRLAGEGKTVKILCVGKKGHDILKRRFRSEIIDLVDLRGVKQLAFTDADGIGNRVRDLFAEGGFDVCTLFFAEFKSVINQVPTALQLVPAQIDSEGEGEVAGGEAVYEYEPDEESILTDLLPRNLSVQIFRALLENAASEMGAKMSAMDNATRNAGEMINALTLTYNRSRQAQITKELIEIISGAEAL